MTTKNLHIILVFLAAWLLSGCGSDEPEVKGEKTEITFHADVWGMREGIARINSINDAPGLQAEDIRMDAYYSGTETSYLNGAMLHYTGGEPAWVFWDGGVQLHYYWPAEGSTLPGGSTVASTLDFVGFCPHTKPDYISAIGKGTFDCDMSSYMTLAAQSSLSEFIVGYAGEQTLAMQTAAGGAIPLRFRHPFALIRFVIAEGSGTEVTVNSVSISDLNTSATCTFDGSTLSWSSYSGSGTVTLADLNLKYGTATTETEYCMVIPKNYGAKTLTVNGTWTDWSNVTKDITAEVDFDWQPGYIYTYTLTVTPYALIVDTQQFTEQW